MGPVVLAEVREGSGDILGVPGRVGRPCKSFGTGRGTHLEVWDGSGDPFTDPRQVGRPFRRSGAGRGTLPEVRNFFGGPSQMCGTCRGTLPVARDGSGDPLEVLDGSGALMEVRVWSWDSSECMGRAGGPS